MKKADQSEEELLRRHAAGDPDAFVAYYRRNLPMIVAVGGSDLVQVGEVSRFQSERASTQVRGDARQLMLQGSSLLGVAASGYGLIGVDVGRRHKVVVGSEAVARTAMGAV